MTSPPEIGPGSRLRLRPSVSFAPLDDGILFKDWERSFTITGNRSLYALFERLLPHLERGFERGALLGALPEAARPVVGMLLDRLQENGMCVIAPGELPPGADAFPQALAYLEAVAPDPYRAFARIRAARVAVLGAGVAQLAAVRALAGMGLGLVDCWSTAADAPALADCLRAHPGVAGEVRVLDDDREAAAGADVDLVIHLPDRGGDAALERVAAATARPLLQGVIGEGCGLAGPLRAGDGPGLADTRARLRRPFPAVDGRPVSPVLAALLGNAVAFEAFKHLAGLPAPAADGRAVMVTREPLAVSHHPVVGLGPMERVAGAPGAAPDATSLWHALAELAELTVLPERQVLVDRLRDLADEELGIIALPHPGELPQVPISTCRATARGVEGEVLGYGDDPTEAYLQAGAAALRRFAEAGAGPALAVLPVLPRDGGGPPAPQSLPRSAMALAIGNTYEAWLRDGIHACIARRLLDPAAGGPPIAVRRVDHAELTGGPALRWKTLALRFARDVSAFHGAASGLPGVHVAAVIADGVTAGLGAGTTRVAAIDAALREAVVRTQLAEVGIALPAHPPLAAPELAAESAAGDGPAGTIADVIDGLAVHGLAVLAHPFGGAPSLRRRGFLLGWIGLHAR